MRKSVAMRVAKLQAECKCLACEQPYGNEDLIRGCHKRCAKATYRAISNNRTTDSKRVQEGKWLPAMRTGRKPSNPVTIELQG
jgi:DNA-directed RNA polymerase subunit RPC12/RpoP